MVLGDVDEEDRHLGHVAQEAYPREVLGPRKELGDDEIDLLHVEAVHSLHGLILVVDDPGEHNVEDETVTLALVNEDLFNFEVAGWYDTSGQLLSGEATYALTLARDCITDIEVRLKPRTVTITRQGIARIEFQYLVMEGGRPVPKVAYDYRTQYSADYKASEPIKFYYEEYRLDRSKIPPVGQRSTAMPTITKGARNSTYLWRCDEKFSVSIRPADNPGFKFNYNDRSVESQTTKYYLPSDITMTR